jgi:hypothetical protein
MNTPPALEVYSDADSALVLDDRTQLREPRDRAARVFIVVVAVATLAAVGAWVAFTDLLAPSPAAQPDLGARPALASSESMPPVVAPALPALRHPLPEVPAGAPLPSLAESDGAFVAALAAALGPPGFGQWLGPQDPIRRIVVTVDNLPRKTVPQRMLPWKPVPGAFAVEIAGGTPVIADANARRYESVLRLLDAIDAAQLVAVYVQWYPRFQEAFRELGYPNGHFNDRLVEAIDTMLAAPTGNGPPAVVQPKVLWEFADPQLEALPAGQKIMLRMGPGHAERVKAKLASIRRLVASEAPR